MSHLCFSEMESKVSVIEAQTTKLDTGIFEYGLFSNILSTLSIVELGFGTALIYYLYKPVANNDKEEIKVILKYYKKVYMIIGTAMIVLGLMVIPFMGYIIKDPPKVKENLNL